MNCPACNCPVNDGDRFCPECGTPVRVGYDQTPRNPTQQYNQNQTYYQNYNQNYNQKNNQNQNYEQLQERAYNQDFNQPYANYHNPVYDSGKNRKSSNALTITIISMLSVLIIAVITVAVLFVTGVIGGNSSDTTAESDASVTNVVTVEGDEHPLTVDTGKKNAEKVMEFEDKINQYINDYGYGSSVAVSVYDNNSDLQYNSASSHAQFPAWGFYVPIYLAYHNEYGNDSLSYSILSSDPTECNKASNLAIDYLGGTSGITGYISRNFNTSSTSYGRKFGQSVPGKDNYTSAQEAAMLMNIFYNRCSYTDLSYKPSSFGISFPSDASVYSQIGTENLGVKNHLNVFAVVRGDYSDYSIALLTKNGAGRNGFIGNLMTFIHNEMEMAGMAND